MTKRDVLSIALKVFGVGLFAYTVVGVPQVVYSIVTVVQGSWAPGPGPSGSAIASLMAGAAVLQLAVAWTLTGSSDRIARWLVPEDHTASVPVPVGWERSAFVVAVRVVGVVLIAFAIPELARTFSQSALTRQWLAEQGAPASESYLLQAWQEHWAAIIRHGLAILIGAYLVSGATHLVNLLYRDRASEPETAEAE